MNHDDINQGEASPSSDEFWGSTPDWSGSTPRTRRQRSEHHGDITGAIKNLWSSAMSSGAGGTREHHVLDATAPPTSSGPNDDTPAVGPTMFDDLDTEIPLWESTRVPAVGSAAASSSMYPTDEVPVIDAGGPPPTDFDDLDDERFAAMTPVPLVERDDNRRGSDNRRGMKGGVDPLLVRIGAAAVVTTLLVPFAIGWTSDDSDDTITSAADQGTGSIDVTTAAAADTPTTATEDAAAPETDATEVLDAESLPPAVVVNPTPSSDSGDSASSPSASSSSSSTEASTSSAALAVEDCVIDYEVRSGDFWVRIADGAGVTLAELLEVNGATKDTAIYPGSEICLPAGAETPAAPTTAAPTTAAPTTAAPTTAAPTTAAPTTAAPTTAAPTTDAPSPAPAPEPAGPEDIKQIIRDVWPDDLEDRAIQIAYRESRFSPTAKNYCCYGLFQIYWNVHQSWLSDLGITDDQQLYDPATNARAAYTLYQRAGGWGPWAMTAY